MKIIDTNIFSKFIKGEITTDLSGEAYTTDDLRNELEILKSSFPNHRNSLQDVKFIEIEKHRYFNEDKYLLNYKDLLNKYTNITSFYGLKGLGDMSILAAVATILNPINPTLFDLYDRIEVRTNDRELKEALREEFGEKIDVNDPLNP